MGKKAVIGVAMVVLLAANPAQAQVCEIVNGSFEDDGPINNIAAQEPNGWHVNMPANKFRGYVSRDWPTGGTYNLTLYSQWFETFTAADMATVSQQVYLANVKQIVFDLKLATYSFTAWDPNKCTAVLLIDDNIVWESNSQGSDVRGEYFDQTYIVEDKYRDEGLHQLALGIRVNVAEMLWDRYVAQWDSIECILYCGGGLLAGDFDRDCYVDINDLNLMAGIWLDTVDPYDKRNLFRGDDLASYGTINFLDFAVYADGWDGNMAELAMFTERWLDEVDSDDQYNLFRDDDMGPSGIVNFFDFAAFANTWLCSSYEQDQ